MEPFLVQLRVLFFLLRLTFLVFASGRALSFALSRVAAAQGRFLVEYVATKVRGLRAKALLFVRESRGKTKL